MSLKTPDRWTPNSYIDSSFVNKSRIDQLQFDINVPKEYDGGLRSDYESTQVLLNGLEIGSSEQKKKHKKALTMIKRSDYCSAIPELLHGNDKYFKFDLSSELISPLKSNSRSKKLITSKKKMKLYSTKLSEALLAATDQQPFINSKIQSKKDQNDRNKSPNNNNTSMSKISKLS